MGTPDTPSDRWTLYNLPLAARLTLAVFLISVGIGYFSALIQLHFQHATPGEMMPTPKSTVDVFHGPVGEAPKSTIERLITADEALRFTGTGQMRSAFFRNDEDGVWKNEVMRIAKAKKGKGKGKPTKEELAEADAALRKERMGIDRLGEIEAVRLWLKEGASESAWKADKFLLPEDQADLPITPSYAEKTDEGTNVKIKSLLTYRCTRCHKKEGGDPAATNFPLETFEQWKPYTKVKASGAMSIEKLAQTTHVHLLGFSMLYGLTGLILALTSLPGWIRLPLAPLALLAQVVDISLWWLARMDTPVIGPENLPIGVYFAQAIPITGALVAAALGLQIVLSLFSLFGRIGQLVLVLLIAAAVFGGVQVKQKVIDKHLDKERKTLEATQAKDAKKDDKGKDQKKDDDAKKDDDKGAANDKDKKDTEAKDGDGKKDKEDAKDKDAGARKDKDKDDKKGD
jgi:hypothetical protein